MDDYSKVTCGMRDTLKLIRKDDNDALFRTKAAGAGKVVLSKIAWTLPIFQQNDVTLYKSIASNNAIPISFRKRPWETFSVPPTRSTVWQLGVSSGLENPDGYWLDYVVIRRVMLLFLIIVTLRICKCGLIILDTPHWI